MKLSIIVPVFNLEKYISVTIESILSINFHDDYEILVINDGSTDRSEEIVRVYQQSYKNIRLISIENQGVSNARNVGLREAKGEYIAFVDGDDTVDSDFFNYAIREADLKGYDLVQGNYIVVDNCEHTNEQFVSVNIELEQTDDFLHSFLGSSKQIHNAVWGKIYRKVSIEGLEFDRMIKIAEDQKFVFDVIKKAKKVLLSNRVAYNYIQRSTSAMHNNINAINRENDKLCVLKYIKDKLNEECFIKYIEKNQLEVLKDKFVLEVLEKVEITETIKNIKELNLKKIFPLLDTKTKIQLFAMLYLCPIYKLYIEKKRGFHS